jgi:pimeloyl-ACP methyl ester carboxylesterase
VRINKVTLKVFAISGVLVLLGALLANLVNRTSDPFKPLTQVKLDSLDGYYNQYINWKNCYGEFQCGAFKVPIDYGNIKLGDFNIAVMKKPASNAVGNLVINPGGPGGSGVDYAYSYQSVFTSQVIKNFNLIGFDPRGVGRSAPVKCLNDAQTDSSYAEDSYPDNELELEKFQEESAKYAEKCKKNNKFLDSYSTANAARDMDVLRQILGDIKLNFLGKSYGTYLGSLYAKLFPERVGRFVLDGAVDPAISSMEQSLEQAVGFDSAFNAFAQDCLKLKSCVLEGDYLKQIESKLVEIRKSPIKVGNRQLTESLAMYGIAMGLYDEDLGWPELRRALKNLFSGNGKPLLDMSDAYTGRDSNGKYQSNEADALNVILCNDFPLSNLDYDSIKKAAPFFGKYVAYGDLACKYLPHGKFVLIKGTIRTDSKVLIIGTKNDPATPYKWAVKLANILDNSLLVSLDSDGHTGYNRGSSCVDRTVEKYLISGVFPAQNLTCSA